MERKIGTVSRGVRCPIIREGDNLVDIVVNSVLEAAESEGFELRNRDVIGIITGIDKPDANVEICERWLRNCGCKKLFYISSYTGEGLNDIIDYLNQ